MLLNTGGGENCPRIKICETLREWDDEIEIQKNIYQPVQNDDT
jgi:hypothetical protein